MVRQRNIRIEAALFLAAAALAFFYYRSSYRLGFDWGDMGSYALYVRELTLGAKFGDAIGYGPLWYFLGVGVFRLWGVNFTALLAVLQLIIFASAVLIWLACRKASGSAVAAAIVFLCVLSVPPFYASTMRMVSLGLFAYPLICLANAAHGREWRPLIATSAAIGVNFGLRADFGYFYTAALGVLLLLRAAQHEGTARERIRSVVSTGLVSAAVILTILAPLLLHATLNDYLKPFLSDLLSYPARLLFFFNHAGGLNDFLEGSGPQTASFLRILPLSALWTGEPSERVFAFLIYSTIATMAAAGIWLLHQLATSWGRATANNNLLALLMLAAIQWPGFALFRPDWVHFISFMHGYLILAGYLLIHLARGIRPARGGDAAGLWGSAVRAGGILVIACQMMLFIAQGVYIEPNGWGSRQARQTSLFTARNGVSQFVSADEMRIYTALSEIIERNSKAGERIVCVPYCPGFAFMTDRRILFREHYVDDGTPVAFPGWIDRAITLSEQVRPPVVIVLDWAPNGTTQSRFDVWAAPYVDYLRRTYARSIRFGLGTIWLREPTPERLETVIAYGPERTIAGQPFNIQPSGESALWMKLSTAAGLGATILFDETALITAANDDIVTALIPPEKIAGPGRHWLRVVNAATGLKTAPVPFDVTPEP